MHKLLIPLFVCLTATFVHAQVPRAITLSSKPNISASSPDAACSAGTFTFGPFSGESNDIDPDTIFLCQGDSLFLNHNGDEMFMDPNPATPPGISYAFYQCPPYATGDDVLVLADSCLWPGSANGFFVSQGPPSGDHWFFNSGALINSNIFGAGNPVLIHFAPITITDHMNGVIEAGCVDVGINNSFAVVYLREITERNPANGVSSVTTNFGNDCKGRFRLWGGFPEWDDLNATYTVSITLASDPSVKALIFTQPSQMKNGTDVIFSVPQAGVYNVVVEDGKSCGHAFQINMDVCDASDNVTLAAPELIAAPGSQVCVPVTALDLQGILGMSFSNSWDPAILQYDSIRNLHPALGTLGIESNFNDQNVNQGFLGYSFTDNTFNGIAVPDNEALFDICFTVLGVIGDCSPIDFGSFPTLVSMDDNVGNQLGVTADTGQVCIDLIPLEVEFYVGAPTCESTASLAANIIAGTAPFELTWRGLPTGASGMNGGITMADTVFTLPLAEGQYEICVTDQNGLGMTVCDTLTVDVPSLGVALVVLQSPTCNGDSDGSVRAEVNVDGVVLPGPLPPNFVFTWSPAQTPSGQTINNLPQGTYSVTVTETGSGCTAFAAGSLSQPAPITVPDIQVTPAACPGVADGVISITAAGGTPCVVDGYTFQWEYSQTLNGTRFTDEFGNGDPTFSMPNKVAGFYYVTITDCNGCTHTETVPLNNTREMSITLNSLTDPSCFGLADGCIEVEVDAQPPFPNPDYLFFWTPSGTQTNNGAISQVCDLAAGDYQVLILETGTGCSVTDTFTLTNPPQLDVTATKVDPTCSQPSSGSITATGAGGTGAQTFTWASNPPVNIPPGANATGLAAGTYTVSVTDANGCVDSTTLTLTLPPPPAITAIDSIPVRCGDDGSLTVVSPTATSFTWTTLNGDPVGNTAKIDGLPGDTYIVVIRDAQNCTNTDTVTLAPVVPMIFADTTLTPPNCAGGMDGSSISILVSGGNPGPNGTYAYVWSSGHNTPTIISIKAGTYTVTVTDVQSCTLVGTFVLTNPPALSLQLNSITPASCPGVCDGGVTLVANYPGQPPVDLDFLWEDGSTDSVRTDLCPGWNTVTTFDPLKGCTRIDSVLIGAPAAITATLDTVPVTCFGGADGEASANVSGGNGAPFTYLWSGPPANPSTINRATGLSVGPVTLTVTDNAGCTATFTATVTEPTPITATSEIDQINCFGDNTGGITVTATGGNTGGYTYVWSDGTNNIGTSNPIENLGSGAYSVTITDTKGCTGTLLNIILSDPPAVTGVIQPWEELLCNGDETTLVIESISGGSGAPYQYSLDFGVYLNPDFPVTMGGGEHYVTYIDRLGCEYTDTIFVNEPDPIVVTFDPNEVEIELGDSLQLQPLVTGAVVDTFTWSPAALLNNPFVLEPFTKTFESTTYTLVVADANGCSATGTITVNIDPNRNVYIPNVFLPGNPRGLNDHFNPNVGRGVETINFMRVFDRWGNLMYERNNFYPNNNDFAEGWDGKYDGKFVNPGVFVYVIEVKFLDGRVLLYRGDVTVIR